MKEALEIMEFIALMSIGICFTLTMLSLSGIIISCIINSFKKNK